MINKANSKDDIKLFSSFDRKNRTSDYVVDDINEDIIDAMNNHLENLDEYIKQRISLNTNPPMIITGMPRSGTTLLSQVLPARYDLGYISNLMAKFYDSPLIGAWLQQKLMPTDIHTLRKFKSHHGQTYNIYEPHEFGYFWSRYLNLGIDCHEPEDNEQFQNVDISRLNTVLSEISTIMQRTLVCKCSIAPFLLKGLFHHTNMFCIHIVRDKDSVIKSILKVRKERLGDPREWWSIRPAQWEKMLNKSPAEQVSWQYDRVLDSIKNASIGSEARIIEIKLEDMVADPEHILETIIRAYKAYCNVDIKKTGIPIKL